MNIKGVVPEIGLPGGLVRVEVEGLTDPGRAKVHIGGVRAEIMGASSSGVSCWIPERAGAGLTINNGESAQADLKTGTVLASELHPVANPVVDSLGNIYVTFSGTRGEKVPFGVFIIYGDGQKHPFLADIVNPTGLAIGPDNYLYITSRHTGAVYRSTFDKQVEKYIDGLGLATGLAFDLDGNMLVGDRSGTIYRIRPDLQMEVLCELEPSVSAFHLTVSKEGEVFVTGPTLATQDCIYRIRRDGELSVFFKGLGRPQGLAFDRDGNLQVAASYRGRKGLYTFRQGMPELMVAGPMLVGLAYSPDYSSLYVVDNERLYRIDLD